MLTTATSVEHTSKMAESAALLPSLELVKGRLSGWPQPFFLISSAVVSPASRSACAAREAVRRGAADARAAIRRGAVVRQAPRGHARRSTGARARMAGAWPDQPVLALLEGQPGRRRHLPSAVSRRERTSSDWVVGCPRRTVRADDPESEFSARLRPWSCGEEPPGKEAPAADHGGSKAIARSDVSGARNKNTPTLYGLFVYNGSHYNRRPNAGATASAPDSRRRSARRG